jgi:hypothetical protein
MKLEMKFAWANFHNAGVCLNGMFSNFIANERATDKNTKQRMQFSGWDFRPYALGEPIAEFEGSFTG